MKKVGIVLLFLMVLVITGCESFGNTSGSGFNFNFFSGSSGGPVGGKGIMLKFAEAPKEGKLLTQKDLFTVRIELENYITSNPGINGQLCLRDDLGNNFGGIRTDDKCETINLPPAAKIKESVTPTRESYIFGPYQYKNLDKDLEQKTQIFANIKYEVESTAGAVTCIKRPSAQKPENCGEEKNLEVQQSDLPIKISSLVSRASSLSETEALVSLEITLSKTTEGEVLTKGTAVGANSGQGKAAVDFEVSINQAQPICTGSGVSGSRIEIRQNENQKVIKCSMKVRLDQENHIQAPIIIKLGYGFLQSVPGPSMRLKGEETIQ